MIYGQDEMDSDVEKQDLTKDCWCNNLIFFYFFNILCLGKVEFYSLSVRSYFK